MRNGKSIIVRVTDRGPHRKGRVIDLSYGAARELGMLSQGIAMVEIERVEKTRVPYRDDPADYREKIAVGSPETICNLAILFSPLRNTWRGQARFTRM